MEELLSTDVTKQVAEFIDTSKKDKDAEFECKLLSRKILQQDIADRILEKVKMLSIGPMTEENHMTLTYKDNTRVNVIGLQRIGEACKQDNFKDIPVLVETKKLYFETGKKSEIIISDFNTKFTLRSEKKIKEDWSGKVNDQNAHIRFMRRKSFITTNQLFRIDFTLVKTKPGGQKITIENVLKQEGDYELEIEFIGKTSKLDTKLIIKDLYKIITSILQAYHQSPFLLSNADSERYSEEFRQTKNVMWDIITLEKRHIDTDLSTNILKDYTVTIKADGLRCGLYVSRDRKLLLIKNKSFIVTWTGVTANTEDYVGTFVDGEYIPEKNLFCIFDIYRYKTQDVRSLPLLTTDEDIIKNPKKCRLGYVSMFINDLNNHFKINPSADKMRIESKLFLAGDGIVMQEAINNLLNTQYEYNTDGIIFTPRFSPVPTDQKGSRVWNKVYKWKPPQQNSIDFLVKFEPGDFFDPVTAEKSKKGTLFVTLSPYEYFVKPREQVTGEYVPKEVESARVNIPAIFQPSKPKDENAYIIYVPLNNKNIPVDQEEKVIKDDTIIECSYDIEK
jgi:hypothetical protein